MFTPELYLCYLTKEHKMANNGFVNQFTTGRPYVNPTVAIARPQFSINVPRLPDNPDPTEDPTKNPTENPTTEPISNPKSTGKSGNIWGTLGKDLGIGAGVAGTVGALGKGAYDLGKGTVTKAADIGKWGLGEAQQVGSDALPGLERIGAGAGEGMAIEAPLAAGTEAVGGGPEDPFANLAAGVEEGTGAVMGAGEAAAPMIAGAVKNLFSLAA